MNSSLNQKVSILTVDDSEELHKDYYKILCPKVEKPDLSNLMAAIGIEAADSSAKTAETGFSFNIDKAFQGQDAIDKVDAAIRSGYEYSIIFMDMRMPPGMSGVEATREILTLTRNTQIVICSAYSDYTNDDIENILGDTDRVSFLGKPFQPKELKKVAQELATKALL